MLGEMTVWNWIGMAATVSVYCIYAYRIGRNHETEGI